MSSLVAEQGETVARIDADVEETVANVEAGNTELATLLQSVSGNRRIVLTVLGVVAFVVVVVMLTSRAA